MRRLKVGPNEKECLYYYHYHILIMRIEIENSHGIVAIPCTSTDFVATVKRKYGGKYDYKFAFLNRSGS